jgi:hypothetical protein
LAKKTVPQQHTHEMTKRQLSHHRRAQRRQRFIFLGGIGVIAAVIIIIFTGWLTGEYLPTHKTIVQVNDVKFSTGYFIDRLKLVMMSTDQEMKNIGNIASNVVTMITQGELEKREAAKLGVKVSDAEIDAFLKKYGWPDNQAARDYAIANLLPEKLKSDYFVNTVAKTDTQVYLTAVMCEGETVANTVRQRLLNGENITTLAAEFGMGYFSQNSLGDFGLHPKSSFKSSQIPAVPLDYAFLPDTTVGAVSAPLADNVSYKQMGYWLILVNDRPTETTANVTAILCTDIETAESLKLKLETGGDITALATQFTQYTTAPNGALGVISSSENTSDTPNYLSEAVHDYIFIDSSTRLGTWSEPLKDAFHWTKGGYWIVRIDDRQENSLLNETDLKNLITTAYGTWAEELTTKNADGIANFFTEKVLSWVIQRATKDITAGKI